MGQGTVEPQEQEGVSEDTLGSRRGDKTDPVYGSDRQDLEILIRYFGQYMIFYVILFSWNWYILKQSPYFGMLNTFSDS